MRRAAALAALALGLMFSTTATVGAEVPSKAPPGFKTVKVKKAGFTIAIPKGWTVLNVTRNDVASLLGDLKKKAPGLASQLPDNAGDLIAKNIVLLAFSDVSENGFTANINVLVIPGVEGAPTIADIAPSVRSIAADEAEFSEVTVSGEDAVKAEYNLEPGGTKVHLLQYAATGSRGGLAFTFSALASNPNSDDFATMVRSIKLLNL